MNTVKFKIKFSHSDKIDFPGPSEFKRKRILFGSQRVDAHGHPDRQIHVLEIKRIRRTSHSNDPGFTSEAGE